MWGSDSHHLILYVFTARVLSEVKVVKQAQDWKSSSGLPHPGMEEIQRWEVEEQPSAMVRAEGVCLGQC